MTNEILTTAQTAKLLGVSIRTAQLLIEGGSLPSWKTPGGHRRVYRSDIEAIIAGGQPSPTPVSADVLVVAAGDLGQRLMSLLGRIGECTVEYAKDCHAASIAVGDREPAIIVTDAGNTAFIAAVLAETNIAPDHVILVAEGARVDLGCGGPEKLRSAEEAAARVRDLLADPPEARIDPETLPFPVAFNEQQRLIALEQSGLLGSAPEEAFDRIVWLAAHTLQAPIALISLLTPTRQVFKARIGLDMTDTPRSQAFCNHTILQKGVFTVEDLSRDPTFVANPAVAADPGFRFYAGAPIVDGNGFALGTLCVIDYSRRHLDESQTRALAELAALAGIEVRLRETKRRLQQARRSQRAKNPVGAEA